MSPSRLVLGFLLLASLLSRSLSAQIANVNGSTSTPVPGAGHDYLHLLSETVDPATGAVSVRVQVPTPAGRGLSLPFAFAYDSNGVHVATDNGQATKTAFWSTNASFLGTSGWSYAVPTSSNLSGQTPETPPHSGQCLYSTNYLFQDQSGGRHSLGLATNTHPGLCTGFGSSVLSAGDTPFRASLVGAGQVLKVSDADGTVFSFDVNPCHTTVGNNCAALASSLEDRNGNKLVISDLKGSGSSAGNFNVTDTLQRPLLSSSGFGTSGNTLAVSGLSQPYTVTWGTANYNFTVSSNSSLGCAVASPTSSSQPVITAITLPNSQQYSFSYDSTYGQLSKITYPSGGYVSYTWGLNPLAAAVTIRVNQPGFKGTCGITYDKPAILHRFVSFDGQTIALQQDFSYSTSGFDPNGGGSWTTKQTTVTTQDLVRGTSFQTIYTYSAISAPQPPYIVSLTDDQLALEQSIQYKGTSGAVLRTATKGWFDQYTLACELNTLDNGLISGTFFTYGSGGQVTDKKEYDYGLITSTTACQNGSAAPTGITPTRETVTTYQTFPATPIYTTGASIFDRPCKVITIDSSGTNQVAETDYFYDGSTSTSSCPTATTQALTGTGSYTGHDETHYGTSATPARGNLTTESVSVNSSGSKLTTTYSYDETGQLTSSTDPRGNQTAYSNADSYSSGTPPAQTNAYLTQVTHPNTGVAHIEKFAYAYATGELTSSTDQNNRVTSYLYNDSLARLTETDFPDTGKTTIGYNDSLFNASTPSPSVTATRLMATSPGTQNFTSLTAFDGLGHTVRSVLTSDPDCASGDRTDTRYDGLGRVLTVSNPYCPGTDTVHTTTYAYDALGRTTQVTQPDNSTILTSYTGRATQVQDEGNGTQRVTRVSQADALGRLTSVCEVSNVSLIGQNAAPDTCSSSQDLTVGDGKGFLTTYLYDALDNLTRVNQGTMAARTFAYDFLSRLLTASNPESGTITYAYDPDGNVHTKTDARNITTTYSYDALNRLTGKTYSDGTPAATFNYDQTSALGVALTNTTGRKSSESTAGSFPTGSVFSYDPMGRIADNSQCTPQNCGTAAFALQYPQYDLLGDLISATNAVGVTFTYGYNGAARLTTVTTNFVDSSHPGTLFSAAHYSPFGALTGATLGNGLTESPAYDTRLRLQSYSTASGATSRYSYSLTFAPNGDVLTGNDSVNGNWTYSYDPFNRLTGSNQNSGQAVSSYVYDRFGNRWQQNGPFSMQLTFTGNNPSSPANNNRMDGFSYDSAGNLLNDGTHGYFYDAESRLIQVDGTLGNCSTATACYVYDAEGRRVRKATASETLDFLYDKDGNKAAEVDSTGVFQRGELYANGRHLAVYAPDPGPSGATFFIHADWLGTERARTDVTGAVCETIGSGPFGDGQTIVDTCGDSAGDVSPLHFTGKERDSESGLDDFGARYNSSNFGRFMSADPTPLGIAPGDPQSWNLYSYTRNRPTTSVDVGGAWYTPLHREMVEIALTGLLSAGEIAQLQHRQDVMDANQNDQTGHFMINPGQDPVRGAHDSMQLIADNMREAAAGVDSNGKMSSSALDHLGDAIHTLQDMTSPMHTADNGRPLVWYGKFGKLGTNGIRHFNGENDPADSWARFGEAIRLTLAAYVQANPTAAAKHGLNADNYLREANRRISDYVDHYYLLRSRMTGGLDPVAEDAARQCALGNPAACN